MKGHAELIKEKLSIADVIGGYIRLEPSGANFKARCPFHMEKTASFGVTPDKGMFYCYGCQKGGDMFTFVEEIENITFREALEKLALQAGVDISDRTNIDTGDKKKILTILETSKNFYHTCLRKTPSVIEYLEKRGLNRETMKSFMIGYSPGFDQVVTVLQKKFSNKHIVDSGVGIAGNRGLFDRFARRVIFPITDHTGVVVGFSGRLLPGDSKEGSVGKYINTPETQVYHKSKILFGYDKAKKSILEKKYAVLVEGNMDVIMLHQAGFTESVGVSGTACTGEHIKLLQRITNHCILAFDQDSAGLAAMHKTALLCIESGLQVSVITSNEKDPADIIMKDVSLWQEYIDSAKDYRDILVSDIVRITDKQKQLQQLKNIVFPFIAAHSAKTSQDMQLAYVSKTLALSLDSLTHDFNSYIASPDRQNKYTYLEKIPEKQQSDTLEQAQHYPLHDVWSQIILMKGLYNAEIPEIESIFQEIPEKVWRAYEKLVAAGFTDHLLKN
jgi:DNA primase